MLGFTTPPKMLPAMLRPISFLVVALAYGFCASPAAAQMSQSDLLTRLDRLEATIRDLTGSIEQLQYRNQQLDQQVQRLQAQIQGGAASSASAAPPPPQPQRPVAPYSPPPVAPNTQVIAAEPPPATVVAPGPASSGRGDASTRRSIRPLLARRGRLAPAPPPRNRRRQFQIRLPARASPARRSISRLCRHRLPLRRRAATCRHRRQPIRAQLAPCRRPCRRRARRKTNTIRPTDIWCTRTTRRRQTHSGPF